MSKISPSTSDSNILSALGIRAMSWALLVACAIGSGENSTTCHAATLTLQQQTEVWQKAFPLGNVGMAPSTFPAAKAVPKAGLRERSHRPHPAVARIIVPEDGATSYGSGTLIDVRENFAMVITNWHVVRDATGTIEVMFPNGFTSKARAVKVDSDWDLAALVIWRPAIEPVTIAAKAPRPGEELTICGYGQGMYRSVTGHCTQYYAPRVDFPRHMVELDVEARQGDSGGPIFNTRGELAGVLFGAGQGTTLGSFGGRVEEFLATLAPNIGRATAALAVAAATDTKAKEEDSWGPQQDVEVANRLENRLQSANRWPTQGGDSLRTLTAAAPTARLRPITTAAIADKTEGNVTAGNVEKNAGSRNSLAAASVHFSPSQSPSGQQSSTLTANVQAQREELTDWQPTSKRKNMFEQMKTILAAIGLLAIVVQMLRIAR